MPTNKNNLGHVIYCIGLTADFRIKPVETVEAHVCKLLEILTKTNFESFTYLSSTRVYQKLDSEVAKESFDLKVSPTDFSDLYNISKLMGESICMSFNNSKIKVARLSNVIGNDFRNENFLTEIIREVVVKKKVILKSHPDSFKDYIHVNDVVDLVISLHKGKYRIYNIASGKSIKTKRILLEIKKFKSFETIIDKNMPLFTFPKISIDRIKEDFKYKPDDVLKHLKKIINSYNYENSN